MKKPKPVSVHTPGILPGLAKKAEERIKELDLTIETYREQMAALEKDNGKLGVENKALRGEIERLCRDNKALIAMNESQAWEIMSLRVARDDGIAEGERVIALEQLFALRGEIEREKTALAVEVRSLSNVIHNGKADNERLVKRVNEEIASRIEVEKLLTKERSDYAVALKRIKSLEEGCRQLLEDRYDRTPMPWCKSCQSHHTVPKNKSHHEALGCSAEWIDPPLTPR